MAVAALTPRVRMLAVCDEVIPSLIEAGVFDLQGVRHHRFAGANSFDADMSLFLLLSCHRQGAFAGKVVLVEDSTDTALFVWGFQVSFEGQNPLLPCYVDLGSCTFPEPGLYRFEVWFVTPRGEAQKAEQPFYIQPEQE